MRKRRVIQFLIIALILFPLIVGPQAMAETITWLLPTTYVDGTTISAADKARITVYLRGWKNSNPAAKTYFGETRGGKTVWGVGGDNTYIMGKMNEWGASNNVPGWVAIVPGDTISVTLSAALVGTDNVERDSAESPPYAWTIYKAPPPPPPPPPPSPSCAAPSGITIKQ